MTDEAAVFRAYAAKQLRLARKKLGLGQRPMAARLEMGYRTYQRLEAGVVPIKRGTWKLVEELLAEREAAPGAPGDGA